MFVQDHIWTRVKYRHMVFIGDYLQKGTIYDPATYTSQQKKSISDFRGIYLNIGISHHQIIGTEFCSDQLWIQWWEPMQLSPNDPPDQNMVNTGGGGGSVAKNGTFVTSVVSIRNNANHADKAQNLYWTTVIEQGSGFMARNHSCETSCIHVHSVYKSHSQ